jgi:N-acetyl-beta-hexosaminidase
LCGRRWRSCTTLRWGRIRSSCASSPAPPTPRLTYTYRVWISPASAKAVAARGLPLIHAPSDYFYLDCGSGEWIGDTPGATSWCDPFKSWQRAYTFDPLANLTRAEAKLVRGGQQLLWTEQSGPGNVDTQLWPRAAVSAGAPLLLLPLRFTDTWIGQSCSGAGRR